MVLREMYQSARRNVEPRFLAQRRVAAWLARLGSAHGTLYSTPPVQLPSMPPSSVRDGRTPTGLRSPPPPLFQFFFVSFVLIACFCSFFFFFFFHLLRNREMEWADGNIRLSVGEKKWEMGDVKA